MDSQPRNQPSEYSNRALRDRSIVDEYPAAHGDGQWLPRADSTVHLPDPDDRHVVAARTALGTSLILAWNQRDFPAKELKRFGLQKQTPVENSYDKVRDLIVSSLANARRNLSKTRVSALVTVFEFSRGGKTASQASTRRRSLPSALQPPRAVGRWGSAGVRSPRSVRMLPACHLTGWTSTPSHSLRAEDGEGP